MPTKRHTGVGGGSENDGYRITAGVPSIGSCGGADVVRVSRAIVALISAAALFVAVGSAATGTTVSAIPRLRHVVVIVFENKERVSVFGSRQAPTFTALAARYAQATDYTAVAHPSLPNYLAIVSGSTHGVTSDCTDCSQSGPTIGSQLAAAGESWAGYAEGYPSSSLFAKKHMPFLYFPGGRAHVFPLTAFDPAHLRAYSFVAPNLCDDMHDCSISTGDRWLARFVRPLLSVPRTAIFIVFDEGTSDIGGGGNVALIVAGTAVRHGAVFTGSTSHYGLLRTTEALLGLGPLGAARTARPITGIWLR